jgi:hypothetical protein
MKGGLQNIRDLKNLSGPRKPMRKWMLEKMREVENNPDKYNKYWSKPWTSYTWRELLELWAPEINSKPN